jgi:hypothetical protein
MLVLSPFFVLLWGMDDDDLSRLTPATPDEVEFALSFALRHKGKRAFKHSDEIMAKLTAEHLAESLRAGRFVIMKRPPPPMPTAGDPAAWEAEYRAKRHLTE